MLLRDLFFPVATLLSVVASQALSDELTQILVSLPPCVSTCSLQNLADAGCQLADSRDCICRNVTLQANLAGCVQLSCAPIDQAIGSAGQAQLCKGIPQESRAEEMLRAMIILTVITFIIVGLRVISRVAVAKELWLDDWIALFSAFLAVALSVDLIMNASNGFGKHYWNIDFSKAPLLLKLFYASQLLYIAIQVTAKASILVFYLRVFPGRPFQIATKLTLAFVLSHGLAFLLVAAFQCTPVSSIWDISNSKKKCINSQAFIYAGAAGSIIEDFVIIALPIKELKRLQLSQKKKIGLGFMFAAGSFACITSIIRLKFLVSFRNSLDSTWENVDVVKWSAIEVYTAIICACLPSIRPLMVKCFPRVFSSGTWSGKTDPKSNEMPWGHPQSGNSKYISMNSFGQKGGFVDDKTPVRSESRAQILERSLLDSQGLNFAPKVPPKDNY